MIFLKFYNFEQFEKDATSQIRNNLYLYMSMSIPTQIISIISIIIIIATYMVMSIPSPMLESA